MRRLKRILVKKGFRPTRDLLHVEEKWAGHNEQAWSRRLPAALRFFIAGVDQEPSAVPARTPQRTS